jgi:hypothetical protein
MTTNPENESMTDQAVSTDPLPPGYADYAGEILVENGKPPRWFRRVPYIGLLIALGYYAWVHVSDPVNLTFAGLFIAWLIYTPIAQKRGWFNIPM